LLIGKGWLGWKNDSRFAVDPVEIVFKFDSVREFDSINMQVSNQFSKEIQVCFVYHGNFGKLLHVNLLESFSTLF